MSAETQERWGLSDKSLRSWLMIFLALGVGDDAGLLNEDIPKRSQSSVCAFQVIYPVDTKLSVSDRRPENGY